MEAVDRLGRDRDGGIEAERVVGAREVVVDRLRDTHDGEAVLAMQAGGHAERVLAADRDQRVEAFGREMREDGVDATVDLEGIRAAGAENRAAAGEEARDLAPSERLEDAVHEATPPLAHGDHLMAVVERPLAYRPDHRVQAGAVTATCQDPDPHIRLRPSWSPNLCSMAILIGCGDRRTPFRRAVPPHVASGVRSVDRPKWRNW